MWERRFAILRMLAAAGDFPHGAQRLLAERFKVDKASISRDVAWARKNLMPDDGFMLRCSYRRRTVRVTWTNTGIADLFRDARNVARMARKWLKEAEREGARR
jgi:hypothetical protein